MKIKQLAMSLLALAGCFATADAGQVKLTLNTISRSVTITPKAGGEALELGENSGTAAKAIYNFEAPAGEYLLTAYATDGSTVNGTIAMTLTDEPQEFLLITNTAYVTNKTDNRTWTEEDGDYTFSVQVNTREGIIIEQTKGKSITAGRQTFLAFEGHTYTASFVPSEAHVAEGYTTLYKQGTLNFNVNVNGKIPLAFDYTVSLPKEAYLELNVKFVHFVDFTPVEPVSVTQEGDSKLVTYRLAEGQVYNYRTGMEGKLTQGGYFTMSADENRRPQINFTMADYEAFSPTAIKHDVTENDGFETGDIFVNINERNYLPLEVGDVFRAHAMRTWQLTENSTNNYFIEPDFHYTVVDLEGRPCDNVIEISQKQGSAWADITAKAPGTVIVLVTYDAIGLNFYNTSGVKTAYMGGEYWGAIWPENTAAYVVSVGQTASAVKPEMKINTDLNSGMLKVAGDYVDAEHDVFYYLDTEEGCPYTFTPENAAAVTLAYPVIGERMASYSGFGTEGVTHNEDGSYTVLLKEGRQIVRLADAQGNATYQVLTAKPCHREIVNVTREGSAIYQPGDQVKIQYSGLRHPANKLAGIYNMSAYVTYNGVPNGTSLILSANQYTFGSVPSAQAVTFDIPVDIDVAEQPFIEMTEGVIQVNGYGDPIGNHRIIDPVGGRSPNFTAIAHKTYFGIIPDVKIPVSAKRDFTIRINCDVADTDIHVSFDGTELTPEDGLYTGTYGTYRVEAEKTGYRRYHGSFTIADDAEGEQAFTVDLVEYPDAWDGKTLTEPELADGFYKLGTPAEMAWFANHVNEGNATANAYMTTDIDMGDYDWTPVGLSYAKSFSGRFSGHGYNLRGIYVNKPATDYQAVFGYAKGVSADEPAVISGLTVHGTISARKWVAGILATANRYVELDTVANYASVTGTGEFVGGVAGQLNMAGIKVTNSYNAGSVDGPAKHAGIVGVAGDMVEIANVFNVGEISDNRFAYACAAPYSKNLNITNSFAARSYTSTDDHEAVTDDQMASGEVAYRLGDAFHQNIGVDPYPLFQGPVVLYDPETGVYTNNTGVDNIAVDGADAPAVYYNLQGIPSATPYKGFNIIVKADGTTVKTHLR